MICKSAEGSNTIRNLKIGEDNLGYYISLVCPNDKGAYLLCTVSEGTLGISELKLTLEECQKIYEGGEIAKGFLSLRGVKKTAFHADRVFRNFKVEPPVRIYIFSMTYDPIQGEQGEYTLYVPDNPESYSVFIPLKYKKSIRYIAEKGERFGHVMIQLAGTGRYEDGAIMYKAANSLAIPIPKSYLGQEFRVRLTGSEEISIVVRNAYADRYSETM